MLKESRRGSISFSAFKILPSATRVTFGYRQLPMAITQGVGVHSFFSSYIGSGPATTIHQKKKYQEFQAPKKNIWIFSDPKKYSSFCTLTLRKDPKMHINDRAYSPILWQPPKNIHKIFVPPKILISLKTPQKYWNSKFWTQKMTWAYVCMKISEYPPPPPPHPPWGQ